MTGRPLKFGKEARGGYRGPSWAFGEARNEEEAVRAWGFIKSRRNRERNDEWEAKLRAAARNKITLPAIPYSTVLGR